MRKIDRQFEIIQMLRGKRLRTAEYIADELGISVRTVYRDIQGLIGSKIPIEGERGVGYVIRQSIEIPPMHFKPLELRAIELGINLVKTLADKQLSEAAEEVLVKIKDALPTYIKDKNYEPIVHIYYKSDDVARTLLSKFRTALDEKRKILVHYTNEKNENSSRIIRPLGIEYWGKVFTLTSWCELKEDFRVFRIDRIKFCEITGDNFENEQGKSYKDYIQKINQC